MPHPRAVYLRKSDSSWVEIVEAIWFPKTLADQPKSVLINKVINNRYSCIDLGKVNLETCWPAVYLVGRPTCSQGLLVTHVLTGPALLHSPIVADQSQASWPLCSPLPSPLVSMFLASLHWFSSGTGAVVLGGHRVAMDTPSVGYYCIWWPSHHQAPTPRLISR